MTKMIRVAHGDNAAHALRVRQFESVTDGEPRLLLEAITRDPTALAQMAIFGQADASGSRFVLVDEAPDGTEETRTNVHGIVIGDDASANAKSLKMDEYGSFEHPYWPGVRIFDPFGLTLATTAQQKGNICMQCSVDINGKEVPSGPPPFGWAEVPGKLTSFMISLQRDGGPDDFGGKRWIVVDGKVEDRDGDGKPDPKYLYPRYRLRCGSLDAIAAEMRIVEARGTKFVRADQPKAA